MGEVAKPDRVFLDANILFGASYRESPGLLQLWRLSGVVLMCSTYVVDEARRNITDEIQKARFNRLLESFEIIATRFDTRDPRLYGVVLPPKDQPVLIDALDAMATHLVTGDRSHFGRYYGKQLAGIWIMTPNDYLAVRSAPS
jgi:predicted nucleic acid-binding protein